MRELSQWPKSVSERDVKSQNNEKNTTESMRGSVQQKEIFTPDSLATCSLSPMYMYVMQIG